MNLKKNGKVFTSKFVGTGPSSFEKRFYRAALSQRLRNTGIMHRRCSLLATFSVLYTTNCSAPEDGRNYRPKHVELIEVINKTITVASSWLFIVLYQ